MILDFDKPYPFQADKTFPITQCPLCSLALIWQHKGYLRCPQINHFSISFHYTLDLITDLYCAPYLLRLEGGKLCAIRLVIGEAPHPKLTLPRRSFELHNLIHTLHKLFLLQ